MGLIVLIVFAVYTLLSIGLAIGAQYLGKRKGWKWCRWWTVGLVMFLIPTWDVPIGWLYFKHLCNTEAGMFVYKKIELPAEYFLEKGERDESYVIWSPYAYSEGNTINFNKVKNIYNINTVIDHDGFWNGRIKKKTTTIKEKKADNLLSEAISLYFIGGWAAKVGSDPMIIYADTPECPPPSDHDKYIHDKVVEETFIRKF